MVGFFGRWRLGEGCFGLDDLGCGYLIRFIILGLMRFMAGFLEWRIVKECSLMGFDHLGRCGLLFWLGFV